MKINSYNQFDNIYSSILELLISSPKRIAGDRTGTGTRSIPGYSFTLNLSNSLFPLLSLKKTHWKSIVHELLWFLSGSTTTRYLNDNNITIWDEWADNGELGPIYGKQWRHFGPGIDQIANVISQLKSDPLSRRHIVTAWNPEDLPRQKLPPCHCFFQFYVTPSETLNKPSLGLILYQRSADVFLGLPFNVASYSLLLYMIAQVTKMKPDFLTVNIGDMHLYNNHINQAEEVIKRNNAFRNQHISFDHMLFNDKIKSPKVKLNESIDNIDKFKYEDIFLTDYEPWDLIKADIAI